MNRSTFLSALGVLGMAAPLVAASLQCRTIHGAFDNLETTTKGPTNRQLVLWRGTERLVFQLHTDTEGRLNQPYRPRDMETLKPTLYWDCFCLSYPSAELEGSNGPVAVERLDAYCITSPYWYGSYKRMPSPEIECRVLVWWDEIG